MDNGDEFVYPGGVYFDGDVTGGGRSDISIVQNGPMKNTGPSHDGLITLSLRVETGSCEFELLGILPRELARLGKWITKIAESPEFERRSPV